MMSSIDTSNSSIPDAVVTTSSSQRYAQAFDNVSEVSGDVKNVSMLYDLSLNLSDSLPLNPCNFNGSSVNISSNLTEPCNYEIPDEEGQVANDIMLMVILVAIMLAMGATVHWRHLWHRLKRPWGILVGFLCQSILLPLITYGSIELFQIDSSVAIGMLVLGSAPGGSMSNVFTYWVDGDVTLSVCMTTVSTVLSMGTMPGNLWLYTHTRQGPHENAKIEIPFQSIAMSLVSMLIPVAIGMLIRWKAPRAAPVITKIGSFAGLLCVVGAIVSQAIVFPSMLKTVPLKVWALGAIYPFIGFALGYGISRLLRLSDKSAKAVMFETGSQNVALTMTLVSLSFPPHEKLFLGPIIYGLFIMVNSFLVILIYLLPSKIPSWIASYRERSYHRTYSEDKSVGAKVEALDRNGLDQQSSESLVLKEGVGVHPIVEEGRAFRCVCSCRNICVRLGQWCLQPSNTFYEDVAEEDCIWPCLQKSPPSIEEESLPMRSVV